MECSMSLRNTGEFTTKENASSVPIHFRRPVLMVTGHQKQKRKTPSRTIFEPVMTTSIGSHTTLLEITGTPLTSSRNMDLYPQISTDQTQDWHSPFNCFPTASTLARSSTCTMNSSTWKATTPFKITTVHPEKRLIETTKSVTTLLTTDCTPVQDVTLLT